MHYQKERNYGCRVSDDWEFRGNKVAIIENEKIRVMVLVDKGADIYSFVHKSSDTDYMWRSVWGVRDTRKFLSITDLFALPSYREGLSNALIEAGSFGIPLLATDIIGNNEIIENNETGVLVKMKDVRSLTNGIEKFIIDKKFYSYIKDNVRDKIIKKYSQNYFWRELKDEFRKAI